MRDINPKEDDWKIIAVAIIVPILIGIAIYCIENNLLAQPLP